MMLDHMSIPALQSSYEGALRLGLLMNAIALFNLMVIKLGKSLVATTRVKARKGMAIAPPMGKEEARLSRLMSRRGR